MALPKILILGHSFIRRLDNFVAANPNLDHNLSLGNVAKFKWHGVGGRTVANTVRYDLPVIAPFAPDIVILQLGTNDLSHLDPLVAGSSIEELVTTLHDKYNVRIVCVCVKPFGDPTQYSMPVSTRLTNTLKPYWSLSIIRFSGATGVFGILPRIFSHVIMCISIGKGTLNFSGVSEGSF